MELSEELVETWKASVIEVMDGSQWHVLWNGESLDSSAISSLGSAPIYVITAYNPGSESLSESINLRRDKELESAIRNEADAVSFRSVGRSLSGSHEEYGFALCDVDQARVEELATRFGQIGYYMFWQARMEIYGQRDGGKFRKIWSGSQLD